MCEVFRRKGLHLCTDTHGERLLKHYVCYVGTEGVRNDTQLRLNYPAKDTAEATFGDKLVRLRHECRTPSFQRLQQAVYSALKCW